MEVQHEEILHSDAFKFDGYQIVRREYFEHNNEPSMTFNNMTISVNVACLRRLPDVEYVQILVNPDERKLAVHPSHEYEKDSFAWCTKGDKRHPRQIIGRIFSAKIMELMNWNPDYRYKLLGKFMCSNGKCLFVFDLMTPNIYKQASRIEDKAKAVRTSLFPTEWRNQFGLPVHEHCKRFHMKIVQGHIIYGTKDNVAIPVLTQSTISKETMP